MEEHDYELFEEYWTVEVPRLASRTRTSIQVGVMQTFHVFNTGIVREMLSGHTNVSPDDMLDGKWVFVNMPPSQYGDSGAFVNAALKYITQSMVLKRVYKPGDPFVVIWCDEAQNFVTSMDSRFLAECRSHGGCMV